MVKPKKDVAPEIKFLNEKAGLDEKGDFVKNIYFDNHGIFWIWDENELKWIFSDETDILNLFEKNGYETKKPKIKNLCVNVAKQDGRKNKPKDIPKNSICFKDIIYDLDLRKEIPVTKDFFITSPIPYKLSNDSSTPIMDKIFEEWVGKEYVETLYEIIAYTAMNTQPLQTIFALTGSGSNGKGTFQNLLIKFLGKENCVSSSIKALITRNFETSAFYKRLLCVMGEADSSDLSNSNLIKQFTGEDLMRYEFKGKTPFSEESNTTFILSTNSLPITPDKSIGFYRRWLIIDFPNQFQIKKDLLKQIPEIEFENLTRKLIDISSKLLKIEEFTNGGDFEDRRQRYEERSNPLMSFISEFYDEEGAGFVKLREFGLELNKYLKEKRLRILTIARVGKLLRDEGYEISTRKIKDLDGNIIDSAKSIIGISKKGCVEQVGENGGLGGREENKPPKPPKSPIHHHFPQNEGKKTTQTTKISYTAGKPFCFRCSKPIKKIEELKIGLDYYCSDCFKIMEGII